MKKILLPVDGSEENSKAFDYAQAIGEKFDAEITILHVRQLATFPYDDGQMFYNFDFYLDHFNEFKNVSDYEKDSEGEEQLLDEVSNKILNNAKSYFDGTSLRVKKKLIMGNPAHSIIEFAEENDFDVVIMCTHGMSVLKRFTLGSVTNKVVHHCKVPVMVVR